jgi:hypothetical protein
MAFERKQKYLVVKHDDLTKYLHAENLAYLAALMETVKKRRAEDGKKDNQYVIVNQDEPYSEKVWKLIEAHSS